MVTIPGPRGTISINAEVFSNLAGEAATNCFGVKGMAGIAKDGGPFTLLKRESMSNGVFVSSDGDGAVSIALHIVVDYGVNLAALCESIMGQVSYKVSKATGVPVKSVDVFVDSMLTS